jgi:hypothetical protein
MTDKEIISCGFEPRTDLNYWDSTGCIACQTNHNYVNESLKGCYAKLRHSDEYYYILPQKGDRYLIGLLHYWSDESASNRILFDGRINSKTQLLTVLEQIKINE